MEARAKLIDIAAFMDRVERQGETGDFRYIAFAKALKELESNQPNRAEKILLALSDPSQEPIAKANNQAAIGAWHDEQNS